MCHRNQIFPCKEMSWSHLTPRSSSPPEADALWPPNPFILQPGSREVAVLPGWGSRMPGGGRPETGGRRRAEGIRQRWDRGQGAVLAEQRAPRLQLGNVTAGQVWHEQGKGMGLEEAMGTHRVESIWG